MKIKRGFTLRHIAGQWIVTAREYRKGPIFCLSPSAAFLWNSLENRHRDEDELTELLLSEYRVDRQTAQNDVTLFLGQLSAQSMLEF